MGGCCSGGDSSEEVRQKPRTYNYRVEGSHRNRHHETHYYSPVDDQNQSRIDLNSANVNQLSGVPAIKQQLAYEIVSYRARNGHFTTVEDITRVPGVNKRILNKIRNRVYVSNSQPYHHRQPYPPAPIIHQQPIQPSQNTTNQKRNKAGHVGAQSLRIATWNLKCFGVDRAKEHKVLEVVCLTILNNGFDLIAFQELADEDVLKLICNELNSPRIASVKQARRINIKWSISVSEKTGRMYQSLEFNGFLWNNKHSLMLRNSGVLSGKQPKDNRFVRRPFIGHYEIGRWKFTIVSVHLKATGLNGEDIPQLKNEISLLPTLMEALSGQGHSSILLVGDFNMDSDDESFNDFQNNGFRNLLPSAIPTNISGRNPRGGHQYDNIWVNKKVYPKYQMGKHGVIREGLKISKDETVSDHCPVWADIRV